MELQSHQARIPTETFNRVAYLGERVRVTKRGGPDVYIVSERDAAVLEALEDQIDLEEARKALADPEKPLSWAKVKKALGQ